MKIELLSPEGDLLAANETRIGFRSVKLIREDYRSERSAGEFLFVINGESRYIRGANGTGNGTGTGPVKCL